MSWKKGASYPTMRADLKICFGPSSHGIIESTRQTLTRAVPAVQSCAYLLPYEYVACYASTVADCGCVCQSTAVMYKDPLLDAVVIKAIPHSTNLDTLVGCCCILGYSPQY